jgi:3-oxoacyl-[acyl-carrier-protein] synthase III
MSFASSLPRHTRITGTGSYLPPRRVSNDELAADLASRGIETSDQWIFDRTGIRADRVPSHCGTLPVTGFPLISGRNGTAC